MSVKSKPAVKVNKNNDDNHQKKLVKPQKEIKHSSSLLNLDDEEYCFVRGYN